MIVMILLSSFAAEVSNDALSMAMEQWLNVVVLGVVLVSDKEKADIVSQRRDMPIGPNLAYRCLAR